MDSTAASEEQKRSSSLASSDQDELVQISEEEIERDR